MIQEIEIYGTKKFDIDNNNELKHTINLSLSSENIRALLSIHSEEKVVVNISLNNVELDILYIKLKDYLEDIGRLHQIAK